LAKTGTRPSPALTGGLLSRPSHAQPILSFPHHFLSPQVTEELQRTFRRVWPRFQPKFYPQYGDRPCEDGQECRKDLQPHPERRQGQGAWCRPQRRRDRHPWWELFPSQPRPTRRRPCKSVRFRTGVRTFTSLLSLSFSPIIIVIPHSRSAGCDLALFWGFYFLFFIFLELSFSVLSLRPLDKL